MSEVDLGVANGFVRSRGGAWLVARIEDDGSGPNGGPQFSDPNGLRVVTPDEWRLASPAEIRRELAERGEVLCTMRV